MQALNIEKKQFQALPEFSQRQVYDFFLFVKNKYSSSMSGFNETDEAAMYANNSANLIEDWQDEKEDKIWR
jgi:hypothetical protein